MTTVFMEREGARLAIHDSLSGAPVVFQHGLGGSNLQVADTFPDRAAHRRLTLDCRAQGLSSAGTARPFSIAMFVQDVLAAATARGLERFVVGGISMGAAIAMRIAQTCPDRVIGLILARPAWAFAAAPANMRPFAEVAALLRAHGADEGRARFAASTTAAMLAETAPDNLASLLGFFDRPDPTATADLLGDIARDGPGVTREEAAALALPTLVLGHAVDHVHPLDTARDLAATIPGATWAEIPPKATEKEAHVAAFRHAVDTFLIAIAPRSGEPAS